MGIIPNYDENEANDNFEMEQELIQADREIPQRRNKPSPLRERHLNKLNMD